MLYGATTTGRDLAPRVASALRTGLTADCTDLRIGDFTRQGRDVRRPPVPDPPGLRRQHHRHHRQPRAPAADGHRARGRHGDAGGRRVAHRRDRDASPSSARRAGRRRPTGSSLTDADFAVALVKRVREEKRVDLKGARIVVSGGVGVGSREGFALVEELAHTLGGVVGASRAAVDAGWVDHDHQVGPDGHHRAAQALHRLRHQRLRAAPRRHGPERPHPGHQQRPAGAHLLGRPLRHRRRPPQGHPPADQGLPDQGLASHDGGAS